MKELVTSQRPLTVIQQLENCMVSCDFRQLYERHAETNVDKITPQECVRIQNSTASTCGLARLCIIQTAQEGGLHA